MAQPFKFSFAGDDIEDEETENDRVTVAAQTDQAASSTTTSSHASTPSNYHALDSMIAKLPPHISYSTLTIPICSSRQIHIPRRELFDVKMQLMAEDANGEGAFTAAFTEKDIRTNLYEGGLKSWECSIDLAKELAEEEEGKDERCVLELGCGTALPSLYLLQQLLRHLLTSENDTTSQPKRVFTLADYNYDVLRLVTLPNIILSYLSIRSSEPFEETADLDFTPDVVKDFTGTLEKLNITIDFISGPWGSSMIDIMSPTSRPAGARYDLILASETIYSPATMPLFVQVLAANLAAAAGEDGHGSRALVAAKMIYFGVGGSVGDFVKVLGASGCVWKVTREEGSAGVGRVVGEVRKTA